MTADAHIHASDEELDAVLDGAAPDRVANCEVCSARFEAFMASRSAIATVPPADPTQRELAIATVLAEVDSPDGQIVPLRRPGLGTSVRNWVAAAAVVIAMLAVVGPLLSGEQSSTDTSALNAVDYEAQLSRAPTNLGDIDDLDELTSRLGSLLGEPTDLATGGVSAAGGDSAGRGIAASESAGDDGAQFGAEAPGAGSGGSADGTGTDPPAPVLSPPVASDATADRDGLEQSDDVWRRCSEQLTEEVSDLGPLVLHLTLRFQGTPAVVFVHRVGDDLGVWVYDEACALLAETII